MLVLHSRNSILIVPISDHSIDYLYKGYFGQSVHLYPLEIFVQLQLHYFYQTPTHHVLNLAHLACPVFAIGLNEMLYLQVAGKWDIRIYLSCSY